MAERTPDLKAIVQEIIDRGGWAALNDMAFMLTGTGTRTAKSYEGSATGAPLLHIEYYVPAAGLTITVPDGATAQYCSMINSGGTGHVSTGAVWFTIGDGNQAAPTIAVPTAGNPTVGSYFVIGQSGDIPAGFKAIKLKTDTGLVAYVRITLIY